MILRVIILILFSNIYLYASENSHVDIGGFVWRVVTFTIFVLIIYKFVKAPLLEFLDRRKIHIVNSFNSAKEKDNNVENLIKLENDRLLHLDNEIEEMKKKYYKQIEIEREQFIKDSEEELRKYRNSIERAIEAEKKKYISIIVDEVLNNTIKTSVDILQNNTSKDKLLLSWKKNIGWLSRIER